MKILTVTTLFPYANNPKHGVFIETRLKHLRQHFPDVEIKVIAPVPWFPFQADVFGAYASYAKAPLYETRFGIEVYHPRFLAVPKVGMNLTPKTLYAAIYKKASELLEKGFDFDVIDGHYFYPDGVAIAKVARKLAKPFTVTARGTDINFIPKFTKARKAIQQVITQANHNMAVCDALRNEMITLGGEAGAITTLRNGVDLKLFAFADESTQIALRKKLALPLNKKIILSVGHLIERKGHHLIISALKALPEVLLLIAGNGKDEKKLKKQVAKLDLSAQVRFLGSLEQPDLVDYYGAVNALVLASSREGWANVLLESMACGTPVVASNIWGTPEVVQSKEAGVLVERNEQAIVEGVMLLLSDLPKRKTTRQYAEQFNWYATSQGQYQIFSSLIHQTPLAVQKVTTLSRE